MPDEYSIVLMFQELVFCRKSHKRAALKYWRMSGNDYFCLSGSWKALRSWQHLTLKAYVKFDDTEIRKYLTFREKSKQDRGVY